MDAIFIALIVAFTTVASPMLLAHLANRQRSIEKREDWKRQDDVAALAAEAARVLARETQAVAERSIVIDGKLDVIHTLVNSSMTAALQSEYDAIGRELAMMQEISALRRSAGKRASPGAAVAITATKDKLKELLVTLEERHRQAQVVEDQQHVAASKLAKEKR